jgi:hypothetical protein
VEWKSEHNLSITRIFFWANIFNGPDPGLPVSIPSPKANGFDKSCGSNFITRTTTARIADAKPSGTPVARSSISPNKRIIEIVPISISVSLRADL